MEPQAEQASLPKISTVVVTQEFDSFLLDVIERVRIQTLPTEEVVVVRVGGAAAIPGELQAVLDNGIWTHGREHTPVRIVEAADRDPAAMLHERTDSEALLMEDPPPDVIAAANAGIAAATQDLVALITPELMPDGPHFLGAFAMPFLDAELTAVYGRSLAGPKLARRDPVFAQLQRQRGADASRVQAFPDAAFNLRFCAVRKSVWADQQFAAQSWPRTGRSWALAALRRGGLIRYEASNISHYQDRGHRYSHTASFRATFREQLKEMELTCSGRTSGALAEAVTGMAGDLLELTRRGKPHVIPKAWAMRCSAAAGAFVARRQAVARNDRRGNGSQAYAPDGAERQSSTDEVLRLMHVSRRYRLLRRTPETWSERIAHIAGRAKHHKLHHEFWAVKDVSFAVKRGEIVGVCGGNGSGKSTLLKVVARIAPATRGTVIVRGRVAPLLEVGTGFLPDYSGRENISLNALLLGLTPEEIAARQDSMIDFAELGAFIDAPVKTYSAGMLMRLGFAILTHVEADILLIDEVLAVGDAAFQKKCNAWLQTLKAKGTTVLLVSHDLPTMIQLCDRVLWMQDGRLAGDGPASYVIDRYQRFAAGMPVE